MLIHQRADILVHADPETIWNFANDPAQWMASNPDEHYGTEFLTPDGKAQSGGRFHQRESVAGIRADMRGHFLHVDPARIVSWTAVAEYRLLRGLLRLRVPQSGVMKLEAQGDSTLMSHDMFIDFPETLFGKVMAWYFKKIGGEKRLYDHGQKELVFFKTQLERRSQELRVH